MINSLYMIGIAWLILIPIILILPLGFTNKGKWSLMILSLFLALLGLAANTVFMLWQTILLLLVLAMLFTYLLTVRQGNKLIIQQDKLEIEEYQLIQPEIVKQKQTSPSLPINKINNHQVEEHPRPQLAPLKEEIIDIDDEEIFVNRLNNQTFPDHPEEDEDHHSLEREESQVEAFFEHRLFIIEAIEDQKEGHQQVDNPTTAKNIDEIERKNFIVEDDYIIQEIDFERRDTKD